MSYSISSWDDEYARISRAASQLRTIPNNHHNPSTSSSSSSPSTSRQQQIHSIQTGLSRLKQSLYTMKGNGVINQSNGDYQRRMGLIEHLENQFGSNDRDLLGMGNSSSGGGGTTTTTNNNNDYYNSNNNDYSSSSSSRMSTTTQALRHQDQMIDELASGVARLKDQTFMINDEANMQNRMLDNMEGDVETARLGLEAETARALKLKEDQSVWKLYMIIAGLSILLFLLIMTGL